MSHKHNFQTSITIDAPKFGITDTETVSIELCAGCSAIRATSVLSAAHPDIAAYRNLVEAIRIGKR